MLKVIEHLCEYDNFCFLLIADPAVLRAVRFEPNLEVASRPVQ